MRIAFWGGSFNPPHLGHLSIAESILEKKLSDMVLFVPAYAPPHKDAEQMASYEDRLNMLRLAVGSRSDMAVSEVEKESRIVPTYTFLMLEYLQRERPEVEFQLLIGADSLAYLHEWHRAAELVRRWRVLTYPRHGAAMPPDAEMTAIWGRDIWSKLRDNIVDAPFFEISSTEIRKRLENKQNTANVISKEVKEYIERHGLYHPAAKVEKK